MIRVLLMAMLLAGPAGAGVLEDFAGRWQGEGELVLGDEPGQRFRCQIRLRMLGAGDGFLVGRCATAQAQQSFAYRLTEAADGALRAEAETGPGADPGTSDLPQAMLGVAAPGVLRLQGGEAGLLELRRDGAALRFTIAGQDRRGPARGEALLQPRD